MRLLISVNIVGRTIRVDNKIGVLIDGLFSIMLVLFRFNCARKRDNPFRIGRVCSVVLLLLRHPDGVDKSTDGVAEYSKSDRLDREGVLKNRKSRKDPADVFRVYPGVSSGRTENDSIIGRHPVNGTESTFVRADVKSQPRGGPERASYGKKEEDPAGRGEGEDRTYLDDRYRQVARLFRGNTAKFFLNSIYYTDGRNEPHPVSFSPERRLIIFRSRASTVRDG